MNKTDIKTQCAGKWSSVLQSIGFDHSIFTGKHGPCIYCQGKDRARWVKDKEHYFCNQCGSHQPIEMAMDHLGLPYKETAQYLRPNMSNYKMNAIKAPDTAANEARLKKIHAGLKHITPNSVAARYLASRGITVLPETDSYFHPGIDYFEEGKKVGNHPCIVSVFRTNEGRTATYHLIYLSQNGDKLNCSSPKKILPVIAPMTGSAIRLFKADDTLCIAEGIETALAVHQRNGLPVWAAGNSNNLANMVIPDSVKHIYIYADEDKNFCGAQAAYTLANKLKVKGDRQNVRVIRLLDREEVIDAGDSYDYNNFLIAETSTFAGQIKETFGESVNIKTTITRGDLH